MSEWQPIETRPYDHSVLVVVVPTADNKVFAGWKPTTQPAYIDEDGNILNYETLNVDTGLWGQFWRCTHWMPLPTPPITNQSEAEGR